MQYLDKELSDEVGLLHGDKHVSLLQIDSMIFMGVVKHSQSSQNSDFAVFILFLLIYVIKHSQITQRKKLEISLQHLKKEK